MSTIHTPNEARIVGGDASKVGITALHGQYQEGKA